MFSFFKKLSPANPEAVMAIRDVAPNVVTLSLPFSRVGLLPFGGRATIVRLATGSLAVFSPVSLTSPVKEKLASMGNNVKYLIAPDIEHHISLTPWHKEYPQAEVIAPHGLKEKREKNPDTKGLEYHHILEPNHGDSNAPSRHISDEFNNEFNIEYVYGHVNREIVFLHKASKTLIEADLIFNLPATEQYSRTDEDPTKGILNRLMNGMQTATGNNIWQKRFLWYALSRPDRKAFTQSMERINDWDFDRIIPCHGDVIETGGKGVFESLFSYFLKPKGN